MGVNIASEPPKAFAASFELKGSARDGELILNSPLGSTIATLRWSPGKALLRTAQESQEYDTVETLMRQVIGAALPIEVLFDWLDGIQTTTAGWQAELSHLKQGRLVATRTAPAPAAELRIILDQPVLK